MLREYFMFAYLLYPIWKFPSVHISPFPRPMPILKSRLLHDSTFFDFLGYNMRILVGAWLAFYHYLKARALHR